MFSKMVVEMLSRSTRPIDGGAKLGAYERTGVADCWLVDPERRAIVVHRRDADGRLARQPACRAPTRA
jgi:Uma2 family endonuclease